MICHLEYFVPTFHQIGTVSRVDNSRFKPISHPLVCVFLSVSLGPNFLSDKGRKKVKSYLLNDKEFICVGRDMKQICKLILIEIPTQVLTVRKNEIYIELISMKSTTRKKVDHPSKLPQS